MWSDCSHFDLFANRRFLCSSSWMWPIFLIGMFRHGIHGSIAFFSFFKGKAKTSIVYVYRFPRTETQTQSNDSFACKQTMFEAFQMRLRTHWIIVLHRNYENTKLWDMVFLLFFFETKGHKPISIRFWHCHINFASFCNNNKWKINGNEMKIDRVKILYCRFNYKLFYQMHGICWPDQ